MDLAVTLFVALAIASIIGTVLQQNQPYTDYLIKFGPFWFDVFESAGLYDVYSALWFLAILTLLVISTSVCVIRNTPSMLKDMRNLRTHVQSKSLRAMHHQKQWSVDTDEQKSADNLEAALSNLGFRVKQTPKEGEVLVSAMRGGMNRLGYIFTHLAIVVICVGGLIDGNLPLKFAEWQGKIKIETRDLPTSEIPEISRLPVGNHAFRGSVSIPEGRSSSVVFLAMRDGYLLQNLPFTVEVKEFRVAYYTTGQPKLFETDLVIHDDELQAPFEATIAVNHPLFYKGYAIYQASFSDGGSFLTLEAWPLDKEAGKEPVIFETKVFENRKMLWGEQSLRLEVTSFRLFNINPDPTDEDPDRLRNFGPSFSYKLRKNTGEALEYQNYMLPVERNGREYYLSGVRASPAEDFGYLYLPVDIDGGLTHFSHFLQRLQNENIVNEIAHAMMLGTLAEINNQDKELEQSLQETLTLLVATFVKGGFTSINTFIETTLPEAERKRLGPAYLGMLREMLSRIYVGGSLYQYEVGDPEKNTEIQQEELLFFQDAVDAIASLARYGSPVYLYMSDYEHVEASGLQITYAPGKAIVYIGCAFLIMGIFLLFYLPQRRFWAIVKANGSGTEVLLAGMSNRNPREFDLFFKQTAEHLEAVTGNSKAK
ncbi:MAG: cytochrome C biogenesis protein ResB [Methylophaga sp.]|nr:MAG: cytochrome C biogenesis protein ResB [Methylophaga sp.]